MYDQATQTLKDEKANFAEAKTTLAEFSHTETVTSGLDSRFNTTSRKVEYILADLVKPAENPAIFSLERSWMLLNEAEFAYQGKV